MTHSPNELVNNRGLILKLAVICKDYCVIREIDDFFLYADADKEWRTDRRPVTGSERMHRVEEWVEGLKANASSGEASEIIRKVVGFILNGKSLPDNDVDFLRSEISDHDNYTAVTSSQNTVFPDSVEQLLACLIGGIQRAMYPFKNRRHGKTTIDFSDEYDLQDLFHSLLRPWVSDIRPEEYTPSYAGSSNRVDFLLYDQKIVCELKYVRDASHARRLGDELIVDVAHYRKHPDCEILVAVIYDPVGLISNPDGLKSDIESNSQGLEVIVYVVPPRTLT